MVGNSALGMADLSVLSAPMSVVTMPEMSNLALESYSEGEPPA